MGTATLINDTLFGNSATYGGGIGNHATVALTNVTIAGNSAAKGGGGIADGGIATLNNTLLARNSGGDIDFGTVSGDNNLVEAISGHQPMSVADYVNANRAAFDADGPYSLRGQLTQD